ncbi:MAG: bifunctional hydroxymethylpyrimidine kinase/phosphomethylpyrimidine kinase [Desulfovibrio aminophilus]|uniref:bifunctional hydroxymethylpyrimidine kinase/phosphomethylpyrimidine kinase n=1 Tax=Desulfovibrio aminophilus TaxID=81425 RepID=UPI0039ECF004
MYLVPSILTIAGSDSGGGAGIQADLKTITVLGGYGLSVITALTAQNTRTVAGIEAPSPEFVALQLKTVLTDIPVAAAKTGMLFSAPIIRAAAPFLARKNFPLVVDPVCVAQTGAKLLEDDAVAAMLERIFPVADLLTPNIPEAELFTGMTIRGPEDICRAAEKLLDLGPKAVLVKGGHLESLAATDWYAAPDQKPLPLIQPRVNTHSLHGTGCTLSAAIATGLGQGLDMLSAVRAAQRYLNLGLRSAFPLGGGAGPVNHLAPLFKERARRGVLESLAEAGPRLAALRGLARVVPESSMNLALAVPHADAVDEVAAYSGRITATRRDEILISGCPEFGAAPNLAQVLLAARRHNSEAACVLTLRLDDSVVGAMERAGLVAAWFDRAEEPSYLKDREGSILEWGTYEALARHPEPAAVDAVCDRGEVGKEPQARLLGEDVDDLLRKLGLLLTELAR